MSLESKLFYANGDIKLKKGFYVAFTELDSSGELLLRKRLKKKLTLKRIAETLDTLQYDLPRLQREGGIPHLDAITRDHAVNYKGLWTLLRIKKSKEVKDYTVPEVQRGLAKLGAFSPDLNDYRNKEKIVRYVFEMSSNPRFKTYYFSKRNPAFKDNINVLFNSKYFKEFEITNFDDITGERTHDYLVLWNLLGIRKKGRYHKIHEVRQGLVKLYEQDSGMFSPNLSECEDKRGIIRKLKTQHRQRRSYYLSRSNPHFKENLELFLNS